MNFSNRSNKWKLIALTATLCSSQLYPSGSEAKSQTIKASLKYREAIRVDGKAYFCYSDSFMDLEGVFVTPTGHWIDFTSPTGRDVKVKCSWKNSKNEDAELKVAIQKDAARVFEKVQAETLAKQRQAEVEREQVESLKRETEAKAKAELTRKQTIWLSEENARRDKDSKTSSKQVDLNTTYDLGSLNDLLLQQEGFSIGVRHYFAEKRSATRYNATIKTFGMQPEYVVRWNASPCEGYRAEECSYTTTQVDQGTVWVGENRSVITEKELQCVRHYLPRRFLEAAASPNLSLSLVVLNHQASGKSDSDREVGVSASARGGKYILTIPILVSEAGSCVLPQTREIIDNVRQSKVPVAGDFADKLDFLSSLDARRARERLLD